MLCPRLVGAPTNANQLIQDSLPRPTDDELRGMDAQIRDLDFRLKELKDKVKATEAGKQSPHAFASS